MRATATGLNTTIARLFMVGSLCFAIGSIPAYVNAVGGWADGVTYALGSVFFTAASLLQLAQAQTPALSSAVTGAPEIRHLIRWWSWQPRDRNWLAAVTQFPGTVCFNISTFAALIHNATVAQELRYVWRPDVYGSILFLISSSFAVAALPAVARSRPRSLPWWIAWLNQTGSVFFMASAVASYLLPSGDEISTRVTVAGTFLGATAFLLGAALMRPAWRRASTSAGADAPAGDDVGTVRRHSDHKRGTT